MVGWVEGEKRHQSQKKMQNAQRRIENARHERYGARGVSFEIRCVLAVIGWFRNE